MGVTLYTIGHSNHDQTMLVDWLQSHNIRCLIDVRRHPGSRRLPQFNQGNLRRGLESAGLYYYWHGESLGGMREPTPGMPGYDALTGEGLRAFAQYMNTPAFRDGIKACLDLARQMPTSIMCAERDPDHCHRQLISDYLVLQGYEVRHITAMNEWSRHEANTAARLEAGSIYYDRGIQPKLDL